MKKVVISSYRISREQKSNPHQHLSFSAKIQKSNCTNYRRGSEIIDLGNGYLTITAKKTKETKPKK